MTLTFNGANVIPKLLMYESVLSSSFSTSAQVEHARRVQKVEGKRGENGKVISSLIQITSSFHMLRSVCIPVC